MSHWTLVSQSEAKLRRVSNYSGHGSRGVKWLWTVQWQRYQWKLKANPLLVLPDPILCLAILPSLDLLLKLGSTDLESSLLAFQNILFFFFFFCSSSLGLVSFVYNLETLLLHLSYLFFLINYVCFYYRSSNCIACIMFA